jgi:hypothetical protein
MQSHGDDDQLEPGRMHHRGVPRTAPLGQQCGETAGGVRRLPAEQACATAHTEGQRRSDPLFAGDAKTARSQSQQREITRPDGDPRRTASARRQESKARTFLVRVSQPAPLWIMLVTMRASDLVHGTAT